MTAEFQSIFDQLCNERGGRQNLSVVHLSVIRALALALVADRPASPATIAGLGALLPAPKAAGEPTYDLSRLDDRELRQLEHLTAIAAGERRGKLKRERHSQRALYALLDRIAANHRELNEGDKVEVRNRIRFVLGSSVDANELYSYLSRSAPTAVAAPQTTATPEPESSLAPAPAPANVVDLRPPGIHGAGAPLARHEEVWRGHEL
jgi:hypothetical protein